MCRRGRRATPAGTPCLRPAGHLSASPLMRTDRPRWRVQIWMICVPLPAASAPLSAARIRRLSARALAMALASDGARPDTVIWCPRRPAADRGALDRRSGRLARADGGSGVVAGVVETPWTGGASRDAVRHRDAGSSADAGQRGRGESAWMGAGLLITQRSRVQIPPPLLVSAGQGPFPAGRGPFACSGTVVKRVAATVLRAARQRDGGDGMARDETAWTWWTLPPAIAGCLAQRYRKCIPVSSHSVLDYPERAEPRVRPGPPAACRGIRLPRARDPALLEFNDGAAVPMRLRISSNACRAAQWVCSGRRRVQPPERVGGRRRLAAGSPRWIVLCFSRGMSGLGLAQLWRRAGRHPRRVFSSPG